MSIMSMLLGSGGAFTPLSLFAGGVQGVWYDPSDLTTMFEDSSGTTAVHTPGNGTADSPVGLLLDKSKNAVGTNGAYRYNSVDYTEDFSNAYWTKQNIAISSSTETSPIGTSTACLISSGSGNAPHNIYHNNIATTPNAQYTLSFSAKLVSSARPYVCAWMYFSSGGPYVTYNLNDQTVASSGVVASNGTFVSSSITSQGNGWYRISITGYGNYSSIIPAIDLRTASSLVPGSGWTGSGLNDAYVWGIQLALTSSPSTYQNIPVTSWVATMAGNHATQSTSTARPTLSAKYNLLTYTQQFTNAVWTRTATVVDNAATDPLGGSTAATLTPSSSTNNYAYIHPYLGAVPSGTAKAVIHLKKNVARYGYAWIGDNSNNTYGVAIDLNNGAFVTSTTVGSPTGTSYSITDIGNGWYQLSLSGVGLFAYLVVECSSSSPTFSGNNINNSTNGEGIYIWGADLRATNDGVGLPAYQRVADANTYDSTGFPYYLKCDGVDDGLASAAFAWGTNRATLTFAYRQLAAYKPNNTIGVEFYDGISLGAFSLSEWNSPHGLNFYSDGGTAVTTYGGDFNTPISLVGTGAGYTVGGNVVRYNGSQVASSTTSQGGGNYGTKPINLGKNSAGGWQLNGRYYGVIVRAATSTATEITNTETWLNGKAKIY